MMTARSYLGLTTSLMLAFSAVIVAFNFVVDPYLIFGSERYRGFNKYKTEINKYVALSKAYHPTLKQHDVLILGNSRVELGIDPQHRCLARLGEVYNLGLPGASIARQVAYAMNLIRQQPIKEVLFGVDFTDFLLSPGSSRNIPAQGRKTGEARLRYNLDGSLNAAYTQVRLLDFYKALYSLDALTSSLKTVALQSEIAANRREDGFNPGEDFSRATRIEGPRALFDQKLQELHRKYSSPWRLRYTNGELSSSFEYLRMFLEFTSEHGITVVLFSNPLHSEFWDVMRRYGHMHHYDRWKNELEKIVAVFDRPGVTFWSFADGSPYSNEPVSDRGSRAGALRWFWEPAHYRRELGNLMIQTMLADRCAGDEFFSTAKFPLRQKKS